MPFNDILLIISVIMSVLSVILVAGVLKNTKSKTNDALEQKIDFLNKNIGDEFHRIRVENQSANKEIREDVKKSLDDMNLRIDNMNKGNFEHREKVIQMLVDQGDKQNKSLESSITKMQESNEKKLEEMRVTVDEKLTATLTTRLNSSFKTASDQLENLY